MPTPPISTARLRRLLPLLLFASMIGPLTLNILMPSLPGLEKTFGASREKVQLTLSLYLFGMAFSQIITGPLADRFGRKPMLVLASLMFAMASFLATFASSIEGIILARIAQALGATSGLTLSRTIVSDLFDRDNTVKMIAYITMMMVLSPMAAPNIGIALDQTYGWQAIFVFCGIMGMISSLWATTQLEETRPSALQHATAKDVAARTINLTRNPVFMRYALSGSCATACFFTILGGAAHLIIESWGRSPVEYSRWFITIGFGYMLGNFTAARFGQKYGSDRLALRGAQILLLGVALMGLCGLFSIHHPAAIFLPAIFITYGNGLVLPNAMAGAIRSDPKAAGASSGLMGFFQMMLGALTTYIVGKLADQSTLPLVTMMLVFGTVGLLLSRAGMGNSKKPA